MKGHHRCYCQAGCLQAMRPTLVLNSLYDYHYFQSTYKTCLIIVYAGLYFIVYCSKHVCHTWDCWSQFGNVRLYMVSATTHPRYNTIMVHSSMVYSGSSHRAAKIGLSFAACLHIVFLILTELVSEITYWPFNYTFLGRNISCRTDWFPPWLELQSIINVHFLWGHSY